ncbi:type I methionyl aminopeptidase [Patescibacteria group bacterium]|nr:type I methionyl aminopeptidase [Patescibacteria group bacterium]
MIKLKTEEEIKIMSEGGKILASIMKELMAMVKPGITTKEIDKRAEQLIFKYGGKPSFKDFNGFPTTICASINEEVVHCIPSRRELKDGDIFSLDIGMKYKEYCSDMAVTVPVGEVSEEAARLIRVTKKSLKRGIKKIRAGVTFGDVGNTIQRYIEDQGFGVVRDLCGHGIGKEPHEDPQVSNYGKRKSGPVIKEGMVFCIEPMVTVGDWRIKKSKDGYGYQTNDGLLSAHFEHTMALTKKGLKILTEIR